MIDKESGQFSTSLLLYSQIDAAKIAKEILNKKQTQLALSNPEIELICQTILNHDQLEKIANSQNEIPIEIKLLVDLDHIWSFTHLNF